MTNRIWRTRIPIHVAVFDAHDDHIHGFAIGVESSFLAAFKTETLSHASVVVRSYQPVLAVALVLAEQLIYFCDFELRWSMSIFSIFFMFIS